MTENELATMEADARIGGPANVSLVLMLTAEIRRLKRGDFTAEEFQALCHHLDENPACTPLEFMRGCFEYQQKLFGIRDLMTPKPSEELK